MASSSFSQMVSILHLNAYHDTLLKLGFDNSDALLDLLPEDMDAIGIPIQHQRVLEWLLANLRSQGEVTGRRPANETFRDQTRLTRA